MVQGMGMHSHPTDISIQGLVFNKYEHLVIIYCISPHGHGNSMYLLGETTGLA